MANELTWCSFRAYPQGDGSEIRREVKDGITRAQAIANAETMGVTGVDGRGRWYGGYSISRSHYPGNLSNVWEK